MLLPPADYSLDEIQERLVQDGRFVLRHDLTPGGISSREPPKTADQLMSDRMSKLGRAANDLTITDPYLFMSSRKRAGHDYAACVVGMMVPALMTGLRTTAIVSPSQNDATVRSVAFSCIPASKISTSPWWNHMTSTTDSGSRIEHEVSSSGRRRRIQQGGRGCCSLRGGCDRRQVAIAERVTSPACAFGAWPIRWG